MVNWIFKLQWVGIFIFISSSTQGFAQDASSDFSHSQDQTFEVERGSEQEDINANVMSGLIMEQDKLDVAKAIFLRNSTALQISLKDGTTFSVPERKLTSSQIDLFNRLYPAEKKAFFENRTDLLERLATLFSLNRFGYGVGALLKKGLLLQTMQKENVGNNPIKDIAKSINKDIPEREKIRLTIEDYLAACDAQMWDDPINFAKSNEFGTMIYGVGGGGIGILKAILYGTVGIGFKIHYSRITKTVGYDVIYDLKKFNRALPVVARAFFSYSVQVYTGTRTSEGSSSVFDINNAKSFGQTRNIGLPFIDKTSEKMINRGSLLDLYRTKINPLLVMVNETTLGLFKTMWTSTSDLIKKLFRLNRRLNGTSNMCTNIFAY